MIINALALLSTSLMMDADFNNSRGTLYIRNDWNTQWIYDGSNR